MDRPKLNPFQPITPLTIQKYERYLPTAFDESLTILQRINKTIVQLNRLGELTNGVVDMWNEVMEWIINNGLESIVVGRLQEWLDDGTLENLINDNLLEAKLKEIRDELVEFEKLIETKASKSDLSFVKVSGIDNTGNVDVTNALQKVFNGLKDGDMLVIPKGVYKVSKNTSLTGFPNNDQPCLLIRDKRNIKILAYGVTFKVDVHAQGILEIQRSENIDIEGLKVEGLGLYPEISSTGYGEKGTKTGGYDTSGFWGYYKNNCYDTEGRNNPSTNQLYGKFHGGFIGNVGVGILIHNGSKRIRFRGCEATGFNYSGFQIGHIGDHVPQALSYPISEDIVFEDCYSHHNYSQNYYSTDVDGVTYERCRSAHAGHPNASITHTYVDPGYGFGMSGANVSISKNVRILNCDSYKDKRKGIDAHKGDGFIANGNTIDGSYIDGIAYSATNVLQKSLNFDISNNKIYNIGSGANPGAAISVGGVRGDDYSEDNALLIGKVNNNLIVNCFGVYGLIQVGSFNHLQVNGNQIKDILPRAQRSNHVAKPYGIYFGYSLQSEFNYHGTCNDNIIDIGGYVDLVGGIKVRNLQQGSIRGNVLTMEHEEVEFGLSVWDSKLVSVMENTINLGSVGLPIDDLRNSAIFLGNISKGGSPKFGQTPLTGKTIHMRLQARSGEIEETYWSGGEFVSGVVNHERGVQINLQNTQRGILPHVRVQYGDSVGLNSASEISSFLYNYITGQDYVIIGVYTERGGQPIPFDTWNMGAIDIFITI